MSDKLNKGKKEMADKAAKAMQEAKKLHPQTKLGLFGAAALLGIGTLWSYKRGHLKLVSDLKKDEDLAVDSKAAEGVAKAKEESKEVVKGAKDMITETDK